jgi:hypothetical protein
MIYFIIIIIIIIIRFLNDQNINLDWKIIFYKY